MSRAQSLGDAGARALLESRARELARPASAAVSDDAAATHDGMVVLEIHLVDERLGVPLSQIVEVYRPSALSAVPGARAPVAGVIAWRGRVLTILDLAHARVGAPTLGEATRVIVLGTGRASLGILADIVEDVRAIADTDLRPQDDPSPARAGIVRGITPDALVVLDALALINRHTSSA